MDYVQVRLEVPAIESRYELFLPSFMPVGQMLDLLRKAVTELSEGRYMPSGTEYLCSGEMGNRFMESVPLQDYGIRNGDCLFMI